LLTLNSLKVTEFFEFLKVPDGMTTRNEEVLGRESDGIRSLFVDRIIDLFDLTPDDQFYFLGFQQTPVVPVTKENRSFNLTTCSADRFF